jgi:hypothetical protein
MPPEIESLVNLLIKEKEFEQSINILNTNTLATYIKNIQSLKTNINSICETMNNLKLINQSHLNDLKKSIPDISNDTSDFSNELLSYSHLWPDIPTDENSCIKKATDNYILAASNDPTLKDYDSLNLIKFCLTLLKKTGLKQELEENIKLFSKRASSAQSILLKKKAATKDRILSSNINAEIKKISSLIQDVSFDFKKKSD